MKQEPLDLTRTLDEIWHECQSEIYGDGNRRMVNMSEIFTAYFVHWLGEAQPPEGYRSFDQFDLSSSLGMFEDWLKNPLS